MCLAYPEAILVFTIEGAGEMPVQVTLSILQLSTRLWYLCETPPFSLFMS